MRRAVVILAVGLALMVGVALAINGLGDNSPSPAEVSTRAGQPVGRAGERPSPPTPRGPCSCRRPAGWVSLAADGTATATAAPPTSVPDVPLPTEGPLGPVARAPDGTVFFVDGTTIKRLGTDGSVLTLAGGGAQPVTEFDDVVATALALPDVRGLAVDPGGHVYVSGTWGLAELLPGDRLREITTDQPVPTLGPLVAPVLGVVVGAADAQLVRVHLSR